MVLRGGDDKLSQRFPAPEISVDIDVHIPRDYIEDTAERISIYRRISGAESPEEILNIRSEVRERFGLIPDGVEGLLDVSMARLLGQELGVERIVLKTGNIQGDFFQKHVEQAGPVIIKSLSKSMQELDVGIELMNNKSLTFVIRGEVSLKTLGALRKFLESLERSYKFFA